MSNHPKRGLAVTDFQPNPEVSCRLRCTQILNQYVPAPESPLCTGVANRTPPAPLSAAAPPSLVSRSPSFVPWGLVSKGGGRGPRPLCQRGYGGRWRPPCFGWGSKGEGPLRQSPLPLALTWECPLVGARKMGIQSRMVSPCFPVPHSGASLCPCGGSPRPLLEQRKCRGHSNG